MIDGVRYVITAQRDDAPRPGMSLVGERSSRSRTIRGGVRVSRGRGDTESGGAQGKKPFAREELGRGQEDGTRWGWPGCQGGIGLAGG